MPSRRMQQTGGLRQAEFAAFILFTPLLLATCLSGRAKGRSRLTQGGRPLNRCLGQANGRRGTMLKRKILVLGALLLFAGGFLVVRLVRGSPALVIENRSSEKVVELEIRIGAESITFRDVRRGRGGRPAEGQGRRPHRVRWETGGRVRGPRSSPLRPWRHPPRRHPARGDDRVPPGRPLKMTSQQPVYSSAKEFVALVGEVGERRGGPGSWLRLREPVSSTAPAAESAPPHWHAAPR